MSKRSLIFLIVRLGVAFAFIYPPVSAWFTPLSWVGYLPEFVHVLSIDEFVLLHIIGFVEIIVGLWILTGRHIFVPSVAASIFLITLVLFNINQLEVLFRDISILAMTLALAVWSYDPEHPFRGR